MTIQQTEIRLSKTGNDWTEASLEDEGECVVLISAEPGHPSMVCHQAAVRLRQLADRFEALRHEPHPRQHAVQEKINSDPRVTIMHSIAEEGKLHTVMRDAEALSHKIELLAGFIEGSDEFREMTTTRQMQCTAQLDAMKLVRRIMEQRID